MNFFIRGGGLLAISASVSMAAPIYTTLQTVAGEVQGEIQTKTVNNVTKNVKRFLGVPFGAPPIGDLRWQPSQPVAKWTGTKDATKYGKTCVQGKNGFADFSQVSEDCLYLNVWVPDEAETGPFPVMLFFYGGSWDTGSAMVPLYSGEPTAMLTEKTVVVASNYRLNVFGFLGSDELRATDGSTGNFGLQDQRLAMQWIHSNAAALNVDVSRFMIFGESAGAGSVSAHLTMPKSWPFFTRAAMESGPMSDWTATLLVNATKDYDSVAKELSCTDAACLRKVNASALYAAGHHAPEGPFTRWAPVVDGVELTDIPEALGKQGKISPVPILLGTNHDEGTFLAPIKPDATVQDYINMIDKIGLPQPYIQKVLDQYPVSDYVARKGGTAAFWAGVQVTTDFAMSCAARRTARWATTGNPNVFLYFYTHELAVVKFAEDVSKTPMGVFHGSELPMVFDVLDIIKTEQEDILSDAFATFWSTFADKGNPNPPDAKVVWPAYTNATDLNIVLDIDLSIQKNLKKANCDFWDSFPFWPA